MGSDGGIDESWVRSLEGKPHLRTLPNMIDGGEKEELGRVGE